MAHFLVPGQPITSEQGYLRGHGTYYDVNVNVNSDKNNQDNEGKHHNKLIFNIAVRYVTINYHAGQVLISAVAGQLVRVNKLISVKPTKSRYVV